MTVLLLGGTGAMGTALAEILDKMNFEIYVTSRAQKEDFGNVHYIMGNAMDSCFLSSVTADKRYDCIVDFFDYDTNTFKKNVETILKAAGQYIFLSSARVYAPSNGVITEKSARLLEACSDKEFLKTDEYPIHKARQEDFLKELCEKDINYHYTIVRPYITYNTERLQLGVAEKEQWLFRALNGRTIVFPESIGEYWTTLSYGYDVSKTIAALIGNAHAMNETFHIAGAPSVKWKEILKRYVCILETVTGEKPKVLIYDDIEDYSKRTRRITQLKYDRLSNRVFDNSKVESVIGLNSEMYREPGGG